MSDMSTNIMNSNVSVTLAVLCDSVRSTIFVDHANIMFSIAEKIQVPFIKDFVGLTEMSFVTWVSAVLFL